MTNDTSTALPEFTAVGTGCSASVSGCTRNLAAHLYLQPFCAPVVPAFRFILSVPLAASVGVVGGWFAEMTFTWM